MIIGIITDSKVIIINLVRIILEIVNYTTNKSNPFYINLLVNIMLTRTNNRVIANNKILLILLVNYKPKLILLANFKLLLRVNPYR